MRILLLTALLIFISFVHGQIKFFEESFNGGVVTGGYSNGATVPSGSGSFNVTIPAGSTIRRAYLMAGRVGVAPNVTVTLNGTPFTFSPANQISGGFTTIYGGASGVHAIDVTASISPLTSAYTIDVPAQSTVSNKYPEFYLWIAFDNASLPVITATIFANTFSAAASYPWVLTTTTPVTTSNPVGLGILGGYAASGSDCENVNVNGTAIGNFSGIDFNASSMWGAMSGFQYYNLALAGYNDDNQNQPMSGPDALSNIQALIPSGTTSFPVTFTHCGGGSDNHVWAVFLTWTGGTVLDLGLGPVRAWRLSNGSAIIQFNAALSFDPGSFTIERSSDTYTYTPVGLLPTAGNTSGEFEYTDAAPGTGMIWYRIRWNGEEGSNHYSEAVQLTFPGLSELLAGYYPNPVRQGENLTIDINCEDEVLAELYDVSGKLIWHTITQGKDFMVHTNDLSTGLYALHIRGCTQDATVMVAVQ